MTEFLVWLSLHMFTMIYYTTQYSVAYLRLMMTFKQTFNGTFLIAGGILGEQLCL